VADQVHRTAQRALGGVVVQRQLGELAVNTVNRGTSTSLSHEAGVHTLDGGFSDLGAEHFTRNADPPAACPIRTSRPRLTRM
jgi:hypothetical protein